MKLFNKIKVLIFLLMIKIDVFARAGGGSSSSSSSSSRSSSSSSSSGGSSYVDYPKDFLYFLKDEEQFYKDLVFIPVVIFIIILGLVLFFFKRKKKRAEVAQSLYYAQKSPLEISEQEFIKKADTAFLQIQNAWSKKDLSKVRAFLRDGLYKKFKIQIEMMNFLKQTNIISDVKIITSEIVEIEKDGTFDVVCVKFFATIHDKFVSELHAKFDRSESSQFVEYWSFIRRSNGNTNDIYTNKTCPNCGGSIEKLGELSQCEYCGVIINSGEYDWVLCEITQNFDYSSRYFGSDKIVKNLDEIYSYFNDFSINGIEDITSNAYMQILSAIALKKVDRLNYLVDSKIIGKLKGLEGKVPFYYDQFFTNEVTLINAISKEKSFRVDVRVTSTYQRVELLENKVKYISSKPQKMEHYITLERDKEHLEEKGSLYMFKCPHCGGIINDLEKTICDYCGSLLASKKRSWIVSDYTSKFQYEKKDGAYIDLGALNRGGCFKTGLKFLLLFIVFVICSIYGQSLSENLITNKRVAINDIAKYEFGKYWVNNNDYEEKIRKGYARTKIDSLKYYFMQYDYLHDSVDSLKTIKRGSKYFEKSIPLIETGQERLQKKELKHGYDTYLNIVRDSLQQEQKKVLDSLLAEEKDAEKKVANLVDRILSNKDSSKSDEQITIDKVVQSQVFKLKRNLLPVFKMNRKEDQFGTFNVVFKIDFDKYGKVVDCRVVKSDGQLPKFEEGAIKEILSWHIDFNGEEGFSILLPYGMTIKNRK